MSGRTAIVTGGASGIGAAIGQRLAADGAAVAIFDRNGDAAKDAAASIEAAGGTAIGVRVDVADRSNVDAGLEEVRARLGRPTILVNSAGVTPPSPFLEITAEMWNHVLAVNLTGTFHCCQAILADMLADGWGRIVNISSSSIHSGTRGLASYVSAKSGVVGLTKCLALEFAPDGITVNTIPPGFIDTPMLRQTTQSGFISLEQPSASTADGTPDSAPLHAPVKVNAAQASG